MKQTKLWLTTIAALLCSLTASAHDFEVDGIYYNITSETDLTVRVTYKGSSYDSYSGEYSGAVTIPSTVVYNSKTYSVASIGNLTFYGCSSLTSINIPEGVTYIGGGAFLDCRSLTSINIPEGVTSIEGEAFSGCSSLTSINIPEGVTSIGGAAFEGCSRLTSINIPESVTNIGNNAFSFCNSLTSVHINSIEAWCNIDFGSMFANPLANAEVNLYLNGELVTELVIPNTVTAIKNFAFYDCSSLTSITIPKGVTSIGTSAFAGCSSLTSITIPEGVTSIGNYAFNGCSSLTSITIPESVTSIGTNAFATAWYDNQPDGVVYLGGFLYAYKGTMPDNTSIEVKEGTKGIVDSAFEDCNGLTSVTLPESMRSIGNSAFMGCSSLTTVNIPETSKLTNIGNHAFEDCSNLISINIPEGVANIGYGTFYNCSNLTSITIPETSKLTSIGIRAFYCCSSLTSIDIPEGVTSIGRYAFFYCSGLTTINIPKTSELTSIGRDAFSYCSSLSSITVPQNMTRIGENAFSYCSSLTAVRVFETSELTSAGRDTFYRYNNLTTVASSESESWNGARSVAESDDGDWGPVVKPGESELEYDELWIGNGAFWKCSSLTSITIPEGVMSIASSAFRGCSNLISVTISESVTSISSGTFEDCINLYSVIIGSGVRYIASDAFNYVPKKVIWLTDDLPTGYANAEGNINYVVNAQCAKLNNVMIYPHLSSMFEVDGVKYVPVNPSESTCHAIDCTYDSTAESINVGETVSYGGIEMRVTEVLPYTFYGNGHIKDVSVPHLGNIGDHAFSECSSLDAFSFGSNLDSIGAEAFSECTNLTSITSHAVVPPTCGMEVFNGINKENCMLRVPKNYAIAYQTADQWKEFSLIEDVVEVEQYVLTYVMDGEVYHTDTLPHKAAIVRPEIPVKEGHTFNWTSLPTTMPAEDITVNGAFTVNKYLVTFKIGDEVIASDSLEYGAAVVAPEIPEKVGYTFSGWGEVAEAVPANDLTYEGSYSVNFYLLSYTVNGETVQSDSIPYGTAITLLEEPTKEGHTFSGWSETLETMPAEDVTISGTFAANKYLVTFKIGDEVIASDSLEYGAAVVAPEIPEKEGYTLNGWGEVEGTVPACDLVYKGSYSVNSYLLTYVVDGEIVKSDSVNYGRIITLLKKPTKEGYTFSGWSEQLRRMPAKDVTISGTFTINKYSVAFMIAHEVIVADSLEYGATIVVPEAPEKEGYTFIGWGPVPKTVPANDVIIRGLFIANTYKVYYYVGEELVHTAEVAYGETIPEYIYEPIKEGDVFEGWVGDTYETMPAHDVTYTANIESGIEDTEFKIQNSEFIYDLMGRKVTDTENLKGGIYIVNGRKVVIND